MFHSVDLTSLIKLQFLDIDFRFNRVGRNESAYRILTSLSDACAGLSKIDMVLEYPLGDAQLLRDMDQRICSDSFPDMAAVNVKVVRGAINASQMPLSDEIDQALRESFPLACKAGIFSISHGK